MTSTPYLPRFRTRRGGVHQRCRVSRRSTRRLPSLRPQHRLKTPRRVGGLCSEACPWPQALAAPNGLRRGLPLKVCLLTRCLVPRHPHRCLDTRRVYGCLVPRHLHRKVCGPARGALSTTPKQTTSGGTTVICADAPVPTLVLDGADPHLDPGSFNPPSRYPLQRPCRG